MSLYCAVLLHNKGANSSVQPASVCRVWRSPGLRLHRGWLIPVSAAFQHVRLPLNANLTSWIGVSRSLRERRARALGYGRHGQNRRGCFGLAKQDRGKLGMKDPHTLYHNRNQSKERKISNIVLITKILICISLKYLKMYSIRVFFFPFFLQSHASTCI